MSAPAHGHTAPHHDHAKPAHPASVILCLVVLFAATAFGHFAFVAPLEHEEAPASASSAAE